MIGCLAVMHRVVSGLDVVVSCPDAGNCQTSELRVFFHAANRDPASRQRETSVWRVESV